MRWWLGLSATSYSVFSTVSVEIMGRSFGARHRDRSKALRLDRDHVIEMLQRAFDHEERFAHQEQTILLEQVGRDDGIGDTSLVFQTEEDEARCCTRSLPADHIAGDTQLF